MAVSCFCTVFNTEFEKLCDCLLLFRFNTFVNIDFIQIKIGHPWGIWSYFCGSSLRGEVGWVRGCVETGGVGTKLRRETSTSVRMGDSWWEERCLYF